MYAFSNNFNWNISSPELFNDQIDAVNKILPEPLSLLTGVTGAGKTHVYLKVIESFLNSQVLVLMPEILLTYYWKERFKSWFGCIPYIWHSSSKNKQEIWSWALSGMPGVLVGARSAILLPFKNLRLTIIDEEHDLSYKQDVSPYYHARDLALKLSPKTILVSATPSVESYFNIKNHVHLQSQPKHGLPEVTFVAPESETPISHFLQTKLLQNQQAKEGSLILVNRRGYASYAICGKCKKISTCINCSAKLSVHSDFLLCHWCGWKKQKTNKCSCEGEINFKGWAVESIYTWIVENLPIKAEFISSDSKSITQKLNKLASGEIDIIIGTQIISQGYDIERISLVIVLDLAGASYDFRDNERLYQLLYQIRGRAGRGNIPGKAYIQSDNISTIFIKYLEKPSEFYKNELIERQKYNMPPFSKLVSIIFVSKNAAILEKYIKSLSKYPGVFGPVPAPIFKLNNLYRYRALVIGEMKNYIEQIKKDKNIQIYIDINPYSFY